MHSAAGGGYTGVSIANVTANITDNDTPSVIIAETGGATNVTEGGATDTYTVVLSTQPTATATISVTGNSQVSGVPGALNFTTANWNTPQSVTVTAVNDLLVEGAHTATITHTASGGGYTGVAVPNVTVNITDNDTVSVVVTESGGSTAVTEGGATDTYTVVLNSQPSATVTITLAKTPTNQVTTSPTSTLSFTTSNWNTPQSVTVTAVNDTLIEGTHTATITHTASGGGYTGVTIASVTVNITDNDTSGVTVTQSGGVTNVTESGVTDTYTVVLNSQPTATVTISVSGNSQVSASPGALTFTTANWNTPQTVIVTAVNDTLVEGTHTGTITHTASGGGFTGVSIANVTVTIIDNDAGGVTVTQSDGSSNVTEGGATDSYTVVLTTQPSGAVSISLAKTPTNQVTTSPTSTLRFTTKNWNRPQTVTVTAVNDTLVEGTHTATITHTASGGGYSGVSVASVTVTITDDDEITVESLPLPVGLELVGWFGATTTSGAILAENPVILRIWAWDRIFRRWLLDDPVLPSSLRVSILITRGKGFFVVTSAPTSLVVRL